MFFSPKQNKTNKELGLRDYISREVQEVDTMTHRYTYTNKNACMYAIQGKDN